MTEPERARLWAAFEAGFYSSAEGFNGEVCAYRDPEKELPERFELWLKTGETPLYLE